MYSDNVYLKCGTRTTSYEALQEFILIVCEMAESISTDIGQFPTLYDTSLFGFGLDRLLKATSASDGRYMDLLRWRYSACERNATDPRDKIFGYYGCFPPDLREMITVATSSGHSTLTTTRKNIFRLKAWRRTLNVCTIFKDTPTGVSLSSRALRACALRAAGILMCRGRSSRERL